MEKLAIIILAAGKGTRMKQALPKVMCQSIAGPLIKLVLNSALNLAAEEIIVVTGYQADLVEQSITSNYPNKNIKFARQVEQLGTGNAVKAALNNLKNFNGIVLILSGDVPLISEKTLENLIKKHQAEKATLSLITFDSKDLNNSYGRIVKNNTGNLIAIREKADCSETELSINECNSGIYAVDSAFLNPAILELKNNNKQKEYYLTDIVERAVQEGQSVVPFLIHDASEVQGVNTPAELQKVNDVLRFKYLKNLMNNGVKIHDPNSTFISYEAELAEQVELYPNVIIEGKTKIAKGSKVEANVYITEAEIGENCIIKFSSRIDQAKVSNNCQVGPFAYLRPETILDENVRVGNFVETKKAHLHEGVKANHLSYLGDCEVGANTNIGAGTITCNYDGFNKFKTTIEDNCFIGSNSALVAPVRIGENSTIGAGSVITKNVDPENLALTRAQQVNRPWKRKKKTI